MGKTWNEHYEPSSPEILGSVEATLNASARLADGWNRAATEERIKFMLFAMTSGLVQANCMARAAETVKILEAT